LREQGLRDETSKDQGRQDFQLRALAAGSGEGGGKYSQSIHTSH
jgi:hypothetical protein